MALILCFFGASLGAHPLSQEIPAEGYGQRRSSLDGAVYTETNADKSITFFVNNPLIIPVWVQVSFPQLRNLEADVELPFERMVPANSTALKLFDIRPNKTAQERGYSYRVQSISLYGKPRARKAGDYVYQLPFEHGKKFKLTQGFFGKVSHSGENSYAIDFEMDVGTPVHAARGGLVFYVKEDSNTGGFSTRYADFTNQIMILHDDDGSVGNYVHLMYNGAAVAIGDTVQPGELIGFSGNTGISSGPHLHFDVRIPDEETLRMQSIPFHIVTHTGTKESPEEGRYYYAYHPGKVAFDPVFGTDLEHSDFEGYQVQTDKQDVGIREEKIDDTVVLFLYNGLDRAVTVQITLNLSNMNASTPTRLDISVPAKLEYFVTLLRPNPGSARFGYGYSIRY